MSDDGCTMQKTLCWNDSNLGNLRYYIQFKLMKTEVRGFNLCGDTV